MKNLRLVKETEDGAQAERTIERRIATRKPGRPRKKRLVSKGGRPTKYEESMDDRAYELCAEAGLTDKQLGTAFGVDEATINRWKREHEDFADALIQGKDEFDTRHAESALLKAALGYSFTEVIKERTEDGMVITREVTKHAAPNPTCLIFWLKNRQPRRWNDKPEPDANDPPPVVVIRSYAPEPDPLPEEFKQ